MFSPNIPGEDKPPCHQRLPKDQQTKTEAVVFDNAMKKLNEYWNNIKFDGHSVTSSYNPCLEKETPYNDHSEIHELFSKSCKAIKDNKDLFDDLQECMKHIFRRIHSLTILKCQSSDCLHCTHNPVIKTTACNFLRKFKGLPSPAPDKIHEGHFTTFIDMCESECDNYEDTHMPKFQNAQLGKCPDCSLYCFTSKTEKEKHRRLFHRN